MRHTHTWTISGPGLSVSVNSITIIMEVVYLEFTQNEYHHHHQDHHHGSHNQQPECGYGVSRPQDDLCKYLYLDFCDDHHPDNRGSVDWICGYGGDNYWIFLSLEWFVFIINTALSSSTPL